MNGLAFDLLARDAAPAHDRRTSLIALGVATLGAALAKPLTAEARKSGKSCGKKQKKQCDKEKRKCRSAARDLCQEIPLSPAKCESDILPCCATCNATSTFVCLEKFLFIVE